MALEGARYRRTSAHKDEADSSERSTCSHGMTIARPIFTDELGPQKVAVEGLPADCVYFAMCGWMPKPPDVVVSGINEGANMGCDVIYSGTVAGAREAAVLGVHGLSVSLVEGTDFERAAANAALSSRSFLLKPRPCNLCQRA